MKNRRDILTSTVALALAGALPGALHAQSAPAGYPGKAVRIVVPFGPGGVADLTAREVGRALSERIKQPVIIDNKPGAGGVGAAESVAHADPDGHTLFLMSNGTAVTAGLFNKLPFDPTRDFAPVSLLGLFDLAVIVPANSKYRNVGDLIADAKARPGKLNLGTIAIGSTQNLAAELFKNTAGVDLQIVPFNGTPAVVTGLRGGTIDAAVEIVSPIKGQITSNAVRALAVMGEKREPSMPNVPTVAEAGGPLSGFNVASWNALAAPANTPKDRIAYLHREVNAVLANPEVKKKLESFDVEARGSTPEALGQLLASEIRRWSGVIEKAKIPKQ